MKNASNTNGPDASYVNGRLSDGAPVSRGAERRRPAAPAARPADDARRQSSSQRSEQHRSGTGTSSRSYPSHGAYSRSSSHRSSHRKRKSKLRTIFKNYGPTIAAFFGIIILAAAVVIISVTGDKNEEESLETYTLPADPVIVDSDLVSLDVDEVNGRVVIPTCSVYGEDGKAYVELKRNETGNVTNADYYTYLDDGTLICEKEYDGKGMLVTKTVFTANEKDCVKSVFSIKTDKKGVYDGHILDEIDKNGVALKRTEYAVTGVMDHYSYLEYDENGRLVKETEYSPYDMITGYSEYVYDEAGRKTDLLQYDANYVPILKTTWEYDSSDRVIKESFYIKDLCRSYNEYEYREDGTYTMTSYNLTDEYTMTYDKKVMID